MAERHVVIPARLESGRLPGKPLALINGEPMVVHVCRLACAASLQSVTVATDHRDIVEAVTNAGFAAMLTRADHSSGTDRIQEVASRKGWSDDAIVVNVQGDEPLLPSALIEQVADLLVDTACEMATLMAPIKSVEDFENPNVVKVVARADGRALYFSRAGIPFAREREPTWSTLARRHVGLYAYRVGALKRFTVAAPAAIEQLERLEQLRALSMGMDIAIADAVVEPGPDVNTTEDLEIVRSVFADRSS